MSFKNEADELKPKIYFVAKIDIENGEELFFDYWDRRPNIRKSNPWIDPNLKGKFINICYVCLS